MSELSLAPQAVLPPTVSPLDSAHPQYEVGSNQNQLDQIDATRNVDWLDGIAEWTSCPGGAASCDQDEATKNALDLTDGRFSQSQTDGDETTSQSFLLDLVMKNTELALHGEAGAGYGLDTDGDFHDMSEFALDASASVDVGLAGSFEKMEDGRYRVTTDQHAAGSVAGGAAYMFGGSAALSGGTSRQQTRIVDAAEVELLRAAGMTDVAAANVLLAQQPTSALELEVGESTTRNGFVQGQLGATLGPTGASAEGRIASGTHIARTEAGVQFTSTRLLRGEVGASETVGMKSVKTGAHGGVGGYIESTHAASVTLDPQSDAALIQELEGLPDEMVFARLREMKGVSIQSSTTEGGKGERGVGAASADYNRAWDGQVSTHPDGLEARYNDATTGELAGTTLLSDGLENHANLRGDGMAFTSTETGRGFGFDTEAEFDRGHVMRSAADFLTVDTEQQVLGRRLNAGDLDAVLDVDKLDWDRAYPKGHGENNQWRDLRDALEVANALPEGERQTAAKGLLAQYVRDGGDLLPLDRLCDQNDLGHAEQWPVGLEDGEASLRALEARIAENPTLADLQAADALANRIGSASGFTVPRAQAEMLEHIQEQRRLATEKLAAKDPAGAEDLRLEQHYSDVNTNLLRCAAYSDEEARMMSEGLGADPDRRMEDIGSYYADWTRAVNDMRETYDALGIDEAQRPVGPRVAGADKSTYQPDSGKVAAKLIELAGPRPLHDVEKHFLATVDFL